VVQVAAFDNHAAAETGVERIGHAGLRIAYTYRNGEDWYVLLLGPYANRGQAERAGEAFTESTGGDYWVRPASAVRPPKN
jgi:septal ring-binding cell division protein DamX